MTHNLIFLSDWPRQCSHPVHSTAGARLAKAIAAEKLNEYGLSICQFVQPLHDIKGLAEHKQPIASHIVFHSEPLEAFQDDSNPEDKSFAISVSDSINNDDLPDSDSKDIEISNEEVCNVLS